MKIYIASSWKNRHAVDMLVQRLREGGRDDVFSFVEESCENEVGVLKGVVDFDQWVWSIDGESKFKLDLDAVAASDLIIYIGPAGTDAWAELGYAHGKGIPIFALYAKSEPSGLMRRMAVWFDDVPTLIGVVNKFGFDNEGAEQ